jgi:hypothetical protein
MVDRKKTSLNLGDMIRPDATPTDTGVPQRGSDVDYPQRGPGRPRKPKAERRSDQMSIRMKPATRQRIEQLAYELDEPIAEIIERAIMQYKP